RRAVPARSVRARPRRRRGAGAARRCGPTRPARTRARRRTARAGVSRTARGRRTGPGRSGHAGFRPQRGILSRRPETRYSRWPGTPQVWKMMRMAADPKQPAAPDVPPPEARWLSWGVAFVWLATGLLVLHPRYREIGHDYLSRLGLPDWLMYATCAGE